MEGPGRSWMMGCASLADKCGPSDSGGSGYGSMESTTASMLSWGKSMAGGGERGVAVSASMAVYAAEIFTTHQNKPRL